ncbi:RDD family protein [Ferrimonas marina]|uniref:Uncharacterized membrane protein YckC, RDD family n=1 Tax=Ferrimonas marina TaxID=299255 RepID=A0A1M5YS25_9GAMM|nr:RDD family protein [Ferrimonas marina]SHI14917.1 Uncharacterized membrane protein YckC, RDD family [Ferrimonas marina]
MSSLVYGGFWLRVAAALIDSVLMLILLSPLVRLIYVDEQWVGAPPHFSFAELLLNYLLPALVVIVFWIAKSATPGKMALKLTIVDANTGGKPSTKQFIVRYLGYYVSTIPLCLGLLWVAFDERKQGWHDKLSGTLVVRNTAPNTVEFEQQPPD